MGRTGLSRHRAWRPVLEETGCQAAYCKTYSPRLSQQTYTRCHYSSSCSTSVIQTHTLRGCAVGRYDLASALTIYCHTSLCFYGHCGWCSTVQYHTSCDTCVACERESYMACYLELVPEWVLVLFWAGTSSLWSGLRTFFGSGAGPCEAFSLDI